MWADKHLVGDNRMNFGDKSYVITLNGKMPRIVNLFILGSTATLPFHCS